VAAADVLHKGLSGADRLGGAQAFEAAHRPEPGFQPAVVGFDPVVLPPRVDMVRLGEQLVEKPWVDGRLVGGDLDRPTAVGQGLAEEPARGDLVAPVAGEHVDDLPVLVNGPIQVCPPACDLDLRLIDVPTISRAVPARSGRLDQQRREALNPSVHRDVKTSMPRSASGSSTSRYDIANRRYQRTPNTITSGGNRNPTNSDSGTGGGDGNDSSPDHALTTEADDDLAPCNSPSRGIPGCQRMVFRRGLPEVDSEV